MTDRRRKPDTAGRLNADAATKVLEAQIANARARIEQIDRTTAELAAERERHVGMISTHEAILRGDDPFADAEKG